MWGVSTVFLFVAIGLVSAITPTPTLLGNGTINNSSSSVAVNTSPSPTKNSTSIAPMKTSSVTPTLSASPTTKPAPTGNSTSIAPTKTSSVAPPTSSASPTTKPPTAGDYSVKDKKGKYCLLAQMNATFVISYKQKVGNKTKEAQVHVPIPFKGASTKGSVCDKVSPVLNIKWNHYDFTLVFEVKNTTWHVVSITFNVDTVNNTDFPNAKDKSITVEDTNSTQLGAISAAIKGYYACSPDHTYLFNQKMATLYLENVKLQPFAKDNSTKEEYFGDEMNCVPAPTPTPKPDDSNIVPIAVGCALAGLVLIVLIAYIIGRRKSQRGYEKV